MTRSPSDALSPLWDGWQDNHRLLPLHRHGDEAVAMHDLAPGATLVPRCYPKGMEFSVVSGTVSDEHGSYPQGTWVRNPPGFSHTLSSAIGGRIYLKTGHLDPH